MSVLYGPLRASFTNYRREAEITNFEISPFLVGRGRIEDTQNLAGILVGDVWNELKGVGERADNEAVITVQ